MRQQRHRHISALLPLLLSLLLQLGCLGPAIGSPVFVPQFLNEGVGRNIRHLPCVSRRTGETGVCMFAFTCARANGTHLGTCIDRFYFGSCCKIEEEPDVFPQDNSIDVDKPHKPYATSSSSTASLATSLATSPSTLALESNDIPGNVDKRKPAGSSSSSSAKPLETTTPKTRPTKRPLVEFTTQSTRLSTFQTVQNASEQRYTTTPSTTITSTTRRTQRPSGTTIKQPSSTTVARPKPISGSSTRPNSATVTTLGTKPLSSSSSSTTTTTTSKRPADTTTTTTTTTTTSQTKRPSSTRPTTTTTTTTTMAYRNVTTISAPPTAQKVPATTEPPKTTLFMITTPSTLQTTQKNLPVTRFPPRNVTTLATPSSTRPLAIVSTTTNATKVIQESTKPTTTRKPTTSKKPSKVTTKRPYTGSKRPSSTATKRPLTTIPTLNSSNVTSTPGAATTTPVRLTTTSPALTTIPTTPTTNSTKKPSSQSSKKPLATATRRPATTTPALTTTTTTTTTTKKPLSTTSKKNSTTVASPSKKPASQSPPRPSSVPLNKQPVTTTPKSPNEKIPTLSSSSTTTTTERPLKHPAVASPVGSSTSSPASTGQRPISTTVSNELDAEFDQSTLPGIVTWTSLGDDTEAPTKTPASTFPTDTTETDWTPITTPDGWIIIHSPTTEQQQQLPSAAAAEPKPVAPTTAPAKPVTEATTRRTPTTTPSVSSATATSTSTSTTTTTTPRPTTTTSTTTQRVTTQPTTYVDMLSTLATVTVAPEFTEPPYAPLNMSNYKEVCGRRLFPESRIVGGDGSTFGKWPWQISLRQWRTSTYLHKCGAALLNENWAITAAHCVQNVLPSDLLLRIGEHDLGNEEEPYGFQERRVQIVASHPSFDARTFEFDLALMRFYEPVLPFQPNVLPICIPDDDEDYVGQTAFVTGWGRLYEDGPLPSVLQEVAVPVINNTVCEGMYRSAGYIEHIPHIFICAGWRKGGFDSCEGDSGGPLVIQRKRDRRWVLAGVISWGIGCAEPNQPGVYTRISEFREWINQILQF